MADDDPSWAARAMRELPEDERELAIVYGTLSRCVIDARGRLISARHARMSYRTLPHYDGPWPSPGGSAA